ncbi:MAG: LacI family DNA-binding transcriptional regulator [Ferruginibacter sp.]
MSKEITIYDLARALNMSSATISRGLRNSSLVKDRTIKKIVEKAEELGYRHNTFASSLRKQKSHTIGVLLHELNSNFITSVLAGIEKITTDAGYDIIIAHSGEDYHKEVANAMNLFHKRVDGIIASLSFTTKNLDHFKMFFEKNIPVIFFDRVDEDNDKTHVIIDNYKCGLIATSHLIEQGCKRIAMLTTSLQRNVYAERHRGYKDALTKAGLSYDKNLVMLKDLSEESGRTAAQEILRMNPLPDGLFVTNDFIAAVCMHELKQHNIRIPEDIAVVGFNNDAISKIIEPQLSTINYPGNEMGEITAQSIIAHLKGHSNMNLTNRIVVKSELIIRKSSIRK